MNVIRDAAHLSAKRMVDLRCKESSIGNDAAVDNSGKELDGGGDANDWGEQGEPFYLWTKTAPRK